MSLDAIAGHFLRGQKGQIFLLVRRPQRVLGCVLVIPPFADEMNKSRRMVTEVALRLAALGYASLVPDLYGTGDSGGDFADGRWPCWQDDLATVCAWSAEHCGAVTGILAIRLGAAMAISAAVAGQLPAVTQTVFWQPVFDGSRHLAQFLRLRTAALLMTEDRRENVAELRTRLANGETLEVAGYRLSGALAADCDALCNPQSTPEALGSLHWMAVTRGHDSPLPAPSLELIEHARRAGRSVVVSTFSGEPFWASTEIVQNPELVHATVVALTQATSAGSGTQ